MRCLGGDDVGVSAAELREQLKERCFVRRWLDHGRRQSGVDEVEDRVGSRAAHGEDVAYVAGAGQLTAGCALAGRSPPEGAGPSGVVKALVLPGSIFETAGEAEHIATPARGALGALCRAAARHGAGLTLDTYGHVMDELDHAPLAAVDAIMEARSGPPPERSGLTVSSA